METQDPDGFANMLAAEESIKQSFKIPERFQLFVTTSRYKEGINIKDSIDYMFVEAHSASDVIQMAGRVRNGVKVLYIVVDAERKSDIGKNDEIDRTVENTLCSTDLFYISGKDDEYCPEYDMYYRTEYNNFMDALVDYNFVRYAPKLLAKESMDMAQDEIFQKYETQFNDYIEEKFHYVKYSYINRAFKFYDIKSIGADYSLEQEKIWSRARKENTLVSLVSSWFPNSEVHAANEMYQKAWNYWRRNNIQLYKDYTKEQFDIFIRYWADMFEENPDRPTSVLKRFSHYQYERCGEGKKKRRFVDPDKDDDKIVKKPRKIRKKS